MITFRAKQIALCRTKNGFVHEMPLAYGKEIPKENNGEERANILAKALTKSKKIIGRVQKIKRTRI